MPSTNTPKFSLADSVHQPISYINKEAKEFLLAEFIELARDITQGVSTCLEIVEAANAERDCNAESDPGDEVLPAVNSYDCAVLMRLSIASTKLLRRSAENSMDWINKHGPEWMDKGARRAK
jgi:hypothetical protein